MDKWRDRREKKVKSKGVENGSGEDPGGDVLMSRLAGLAKLHEQGALTDEEFDQKKSELLAKM